MDERREAAARLREAMAGKTPVDRYVMKRLRPEDEELTRVHEVNHVKVLAGDVVHAAELVAPAPADKIVGTLRAGCAVGKPERVVMIQCSHLQHLLDQVEKAVGSVGEGSVRETLRDTASGGGAGLV